MAASIDQDRLWADVMALAEITEPDRPWTRRSFTPRFDEGRAWLRGRMEEAGLAVHVDAAGNMIGRVEGTRQGAPAILVGSHIDTVPSGGRFDGIAGVATGLEIVRALRDAGERLDHPLEVIDCLAEEPSEFGIACIGSRALTGHLSDDMLAATRADGVVLRDAIAHVGGRPDELGRPLRDDVAAYFELHIEQARVLETAGLSVGIVTGIAAVTRFSITFEGAADHAGATPLELRADALLAASESIVQTRALAERVAAQSDSYFVTTVGIIESEPNAANVVPAKTRIVVDMRSRSQADKERFIAELDAATTSAASRYGARRTEFRMLSDSEPATADPSLRAVLAQSAAELDLKTIDLASGAGHDALFMASIAPMAMVFIPCLNGKSHCAEEWATAEDLRDGAATILAAMRRVDREPVRPGR